MFFVVLFSAFESSALPKINGNLNKSGQYVIKADEVDGDQLNNMLTAYGNVEISKGGSVVHADKLIYDRDNGHIRAIGHVRIKNLEVGNITAESAEIDDDFGRGKFTNSKLIFVDGSYMTSHDITRESEAVTILKKPFYSICPSPEIAEDNELAGKKRNMASIRSSQTTIDRNEQVTRSKHGVLSLYNVPVLYIPYLKTTLPSKKRESGFLTPSYAKSTNLGLGVRTPYYLNLAPNYDLTVTPFFGINSGQIILANEFRHEASYGQHRINFEIANNKLVPNTTITASDRVKKEYRWNLNTTGDFDFTKNVGVDYKVDTVSDRNYFKDYHFSYFAFTLSRGSIDYIKGRNYHAFSLVNIQELENKDTQKQAPFVPEIDSYVERKPMFFNEKIALSSNTAVMYRRDGLQYRRVSLTPEFSLPLNLQGNLFSFDGKLQGDLYSLENNYSGNRSNTYSDVFTNYKPEAALKWRLPLIKKAKKSTLLIEPMANFVASSFQKDASKLPNEDSNSSELTVSNLFATDRISGYDRNEAGKRLSYGVKTSYFNDYGEFGLIAGQSYRQKDRAQDVQIRGFARNNKSNVVGQALYKAQKYFSLIYSFQLDQSNYTNDVNQLSAALTFSRFKLTTNYLLIRRSSQNTDKKEQVSVMMEGNLSKRWRATFSTTQDAVLNRTIYRTLAFYRDGCCTTFGFSMSETNPSNLVKPQTTYNLLFSFKNL